MSTPVNLPALGESVTEGTITRWLKSVGDTVEVDEPLLEVSTDKVDTEIPSPVAGPLQEIKVEEDETVEVGAELAIIGDGSGSSDSSDSSDDEPEEQDEPEAKEEPEPEKAPEPKDEEEPEPEPEKEPEPEPEPEPAKAEEKPKQEPAQKSTQPESSS